MSDGPWEWLWDHEKVVSNADGSEYDLGVDEEGDVLIHHAGHCKTVSPRNLRKVIERAGEEYHDVILNE